MLRTLYRKSTPLLLAVLIAGMTIVPACSDDDNPADTKADPVATHDAAESIYVSLGYNSGGAIDQISDMMAMATPEGIANVVYAGNAPAHTVDSSYNTTTGTWTITLARVDTAITWYWANYSRTYTIRFLDAQGTPQRYYIVARQGGGFDTARSMVFTVTAGTGRFFTVRFRHKLTDFSANITATNLNTNIVTFNGNWQRSTDDTLMTEFFGRNLTSSLTLNFNNVQVAKGAARHISGNLSGSFAGAVDFFYGKEYNERIIDRVFTVDLASSIGTITINSTIFKGSLITGLIVL